MKKCLNDSVIEIKPVVGFIVGETALNFRKAIW